MYKNTEVHKGNNTSMFTEVLFINANIFLILYASGPIKPGSKQLKTT